MGWVIKFFETERGEKPVGEFIKSCQGSTRAKVLRQIDLLEKYGRLLIMPHARKLTQELYELRVRGKEEIRIIYAILGDRIFLLHGFKKKTQKTPQREIETALSRFLSLTTT